MAAETKVPPARELLRTMRPYTRPHLWAVGLVLLAAIIGAAAGLAMPQILGMLIDGPIADGDRSALLPATLLVAGLGLFEALLHFLRRLGVISGATRIEYDLRLALFAHLLEQPAAFHDSWPSGQLLTRISQDTGVIRRWIAFGAVMLFAAISMIGIGTVLMARTSWLLALVYLLGSVPLVWLTHRFERVYRGLVRQVQDKSGDVATVVEESVKGIRILKAFGRAEEALKRFGGEAEQLRDLEIARGLADARISRWLTLIPNLIIAICLMLAIWFAALGWVTIGGIVAFFATATILRVPIVMSGFLISFTLEAMAATARIKELLDCQPTIVDPAEPRTLPQPAPTGPRGAELRFHNVVFKFDDARPADKPVLDGLDLVVAPGERLALIGLTGSGKSTVINLAARLYDVTGGAILLDGIDLRDLPRAELRSQLAVAFDDPTLFSASIRDNILLGAPAAADQVLTEALQVAAVDFLDELPHGVETVIGEDGMSLSGGQRQRLALARAVATRPRLMLLDDPLSALDVATEQRVMAALAASLADTTVVIVAHRPSTVALADRVALLDRGRIIATGSHAELLANNERYRYVISSLAQRERGNE